MENQQIKQKQQIQVTEQYQNPSKSFQITQSQIDEFQQNGFIAFANVFEPSSVLKLNHRLELVLRGIYNTGMKPDKIPKLVKVPLPDGIVNDDDDNVDDNDVGQEVGKDDGDYIGDEFKCGKDDGDKEQSPCLIKEKSNYIIASNASLNNEHDKNDAKQTQSPKEEEVNKSTNKIKTKTKPSKRKKKRPKSIGPLGYSGNKHNNKVMQIINVHKCDTFFRDLVTTETLGYMVSKLMKWNNGARLAQDQIWAKPPGSPPLAYHRDSPYFMFDPCPVATVWIALDDMYDEDIGPLTYVKSSHLWNDGRVGSSQNFFQSNGGVALLYSAAERAGVSDYKDSLEYVSMKGLGAGGLSIHDGRTWHGSGGNKSDRPRRGIGLHFVPVDVKWTESAMNSKLWRRYVQDAVENGEDVGSIEIDECDFPVVYRN